MNEVEQKSWLKLGRYTEIKAETIKTLCGICNNNLDIVFEELARMSAASPTGKIKAPKNEAVEAEFEAIQKAGANIIPFNNEFYPKLMQNVPQAPILLTTMGNKALLGKSNIIAIVGSRTPLASTTAFIKHITADFVKAGFSTVSGLALGVDTAAHEATLDTVDEIPNSEAGTIAVLGNGLGHAYPPQNTDKQKRIATHRGGVVVSEFPFFNTPTTYSFPKRNLTIAGIGKATLIVEARFGSGSLVTANYATKLKRPLFAVPGFPNDERHHGTNHLIKMGKATITGSANDVLDLITNKSFSFGNQVFDSKKGEEILIPTLNKEPIPSPTQQTKNLILSSLSKEPVSAIVVAEALNLTLMEVIICLLELEVEELVERTFDGGFIVVSK